MKKKPRGKRKGYTTGANSAAAARAATIGLATGKVPSELESLLPNETRVKFIIHDGVISENGKAAHAMCIKDAGDDPDCTDGAHLTADVRLIDGQAGEVVLKGGQRCGHDYHGRPWFGSGWPCD